MRHGQCHAALRGGSREFVQHHDGQRLHGRRHRRHCILLPDVDIDSVSIDRDQTRSCVACSRSAARVRQALLGLAAYDLQSMPWTHVFGLVTKPLNDGLDTRPIEFAMVPLGNTDGIDQILVTPGQHFEQNQIFR
jgi:hypothetical protein